MTIQAGRDAHPSTAASVGDATVLVVRRVIEELADTRISDLPAVIERSRDDGAFVWVNLVDPDERQVDQARTTFGMHPIAATDVASGRQQPKVQKFGDNLFALLWQILPGAGDIRLGHTSIYIGKDWLLTVQRADGADASDLRELVESVPAELRGSPLAAAYVIMSHVIDGYADAAADVETALVELEEQVFNESTGEDHARIYRVRKNIGRIDRAVSSIAAALRESTGHLEAMTIGHEHVVPYLHDLLDDAAGTVALINKQSRALDAVLSSHENNVAARQSKDMRTISAFAAMLAIPTLVAALYGMNFRNIPLVHWQFGWVVVAVTIVTADFVIYVMFKRRHWL